MRRTKGLVATLQLKEKVGCVCHVFQGDQGWCPVHGSAMRGKRESKEQAWKSVGKEHPVNPNFFWETSGGCQLHPKNMRTFHLFNALEILWHRKPFWSTHIMVLRSEAIANLFNELMNRADRTEYMEQKMRKIAQSVVKKKK